MNIVDLILALGLFWFARKGWQIGLVQSLIMLFSVILAYGFALTYGETTARALFDTTEDLGTGTALIGFFVVFAAVLAACYFLGRTLHGILRTSPLGAIDAFGGIALGLVQGALILGLIAIFLHAKPIHSRVPEFIDNSALGAPLQKSARVIADGVQAMFPDVKTLLETLGIQIQKTPPLIEKLNKEASEARKKINEILEESK
ncbi:MAG: CvpA family protein [Candidatus Latescibacteria bacterium]|nr:CvpA family protein [Candidatus Latescibacterota bacterium]MCY4352738.1 CvpA family protein [Gemmatimonadota bacterium]